MVANVNVWHWTKVTYIHSIDKLLRLYLSRQVPEVRDYMFSRSFVPEEQLHKMSHEIEPPISSKFAAAVSSQPSTGLDRLQSNLFRNATTGRVIGRRALGIMKPQTSGVAV